MNKSMLAFRRYLEINNLIKRFIPYLFMIGMSASLHAELPPAYYEQLKENAPESIVITVNQVEKTSKPDEYEQITAIATVSKVDRTRTNLKSGDRIVISYDRMTHHEMGWVGPAEVQELLEKHVYQCYLESVGGGGKFFAPAAMGQSFYSITKK